MANLKDLRRPANPEAARLAAFYVPQILKLSGIAKETAQDIASNAHKKSQPLQEFNAALERGFEVMAAQAKKDAEEARRKNRAENGYQPEQELAPEDVEALLELPL